MAWSSWFDLTPNEVANEAPTSCGVFCVARKTSSIVYPAGSSTTVLLGAATDWQLGLRAVLAALAAGRSSALEEERRAGGGLRFCFQANLGGGAGPLHAAILNDFIRQHGGLPRCNATR
jgi:hypothetical protein